MIITLEIYIKNLSITDRESSFDLLALYLENKDENKASLLIDNLISIDPNDDDFIFRINADRSSRMEAAKIIAKPICFDIGKA